MDSPKHSPTIQKLLEENARLLSRIQELEVGKGKENPRLSRPVKIKNETTVSIEAHLKIEPGLKRRDLVGNSGDEIKHKVQLETPIKLSKKRAVKSENAPNKKIKLEFVGVALPSLYVLPLLYLMRHSRSISPGPGDTDSEREDVKPKIEHQEGEIQFYGMARPIPDDFEEKKPNIKQELDLDENTLKERLRGFATFPVTLGNTLRMRTFSCELISSIFGGNMQRMCPSIGKKHLARHGRPNWMFTNNCMYQPNAPNEPGGSGLVYRSTPFAPSNGQDETIVRHLFICIKPSEWLYAGDYKWVRAEPLTQAEWAEQGSKFKSAWIKVLHTEGWGAGVRAMIRLRRRLNREPTEGEIETALDIYKEALEEEELGQPRPKKPRISDISSDDLVVQKAKELTDNWGENELRLAKSKKPEVKQKSTQLKHVVFFAIDEAQSLTKPVTSGNGQITPFYYLRQILRACRDLPLFSVLLSTRTTSNIDQFVPPKENDASARLQHRYLQLIPPFCALGWDHGALSFPDPPTLSAVASLEYKPSLGRPLFASRYRAGLDLPDEEERSEFLKDIVNFAAQKLIRNEVRPAQLNNDQLLACLSARLPIEFMSSTPTQGEKDQVGNHMRVCLSINKSVCRFTSFFSPLGNNVRGWGFNYRKDDEEYESLGCEWRRLSGVQT
ncbi:hypothetical protein D9757_004025 [Collybiopsis confluens]|uniref:DUF6697 domain-containing protein n=1 Tax=Collybiopsis confluens TaxID=2823264 RepID=A0A8H5MEG0_9AGAR|nr:hypothetical protein D9757_004025 [Collybiopsis confluens]